MKAEFAPLFHLGRAQRLQPAVDLWDGIADEESGENAPVLASWKQSELRRRKENLAQIPASALSWEQVMQMPRNSGETKKPARNKRHGQDRWFTPRRTGIKDPQ